MNNCFTKDTQAIAIICLTKPKYSAWLTEQDKFTQSWLNNTGYQAKPGKFSLIPNNDGAIDKVVLGVEDHKDMWNLAALPTSLPEGNYRVENLTDLQALGWGLGSYQFNRYRSAQTNNSLA